MNRKFLTILALAVLLVAGAVALWNRPSPDSTEVAQPAGQTPLRPSSARDDRSSPAGANPYGETTEQREAREIQGEIERDHMTDLWQQNASLAFTKTSDHLVTDLKLTAEQAAKVKEIFSQRQQELAKLFGIMTSGDTADEMELLRRITALIRNKGLRADLENVLTPDQLKAFDESEAKRDKELVEARAYRDMAAINAVVPLSDTQKQQALGVLTAQAAKKVEQEADSRAFMSLMYGGLAAGMDSSNLMGLTDMVNMDPLQATQMEYGSEEHQKWMEQKRAERIDHELTPLRSVLDEAQFTRYREHLEQQPLR